jgi:hypothetical protein
MMNTRRTYSLMLFSFFLPSNMSNGARFGTKRMRLELQLALDGEVLHRQVLLPVVAQRLVEGGVLVLRDVVRVARPDGLLLVQQRPTRRHLLHLLRLLVLVGSSSVTVL